MNHQHFEYFNILVVLVVPVLALSVSPWVPFNHLTLIWSIVYYVIAQLGITAGYHRLFSHKSYHAHPILRYLLMIAGSAAFQGSVKWWSRGHRVHHQFTDTKFDPYSTVHGFWWAHIGWMMVRQPRSLRVVIDIDDLKHDNILEAQHRYFYIIGPLAAFVLPTLVCGIGWQDWWGGLVYAGCIRTACNQHSTFCVNSICHWFGDATYGHVRTARDWIFLSFLTMGEGHHNFHHTFPSDYRASPVESWLDFNPGRWLIDWMTYCGLASRLQKANQLDIERARLLELRYQVDKQLTTLDQYPQADELNMCDLPIMSLAVSLAKSPGETLLVFHHLICNVSDFMSQHPGGSELLTLHHGKDITDVFTNGNHIHSEAAIRQLKKFAVAKLKS